MLPGDRSSSSGGGQPAQSEKSGIVAAAVLMAGLVVSFIPALGLALGDDHYGREMGRYALHADAALGLGLDGAGWGTVWAPYSTAPYAHHPPLDVAVHTAVAWAQGGATAGGSRAVGTTAAVLAMAACFVAARRLGGSAWVGAAAVGALSASGFFWTFGRLHLAFAVSMGFLAARAVFRDRNGPGVELVFFAIGLTAALASWEDAMFVGLVALLDLRRIRLRALVTGIGVAVGLLLDLAWIEWTVGLDALVDHLQDRAASADYTPLEWVVRQGGFYLRFESVPAFVVTLAGVVTALGDARFRVPVVALTLTVGTFALVFHQNAWVHEYWNWKSGYLLALGMAALAARYGRRMAPRLVPSVVVAVVVAVSLLPIARLWGGIYETQFEATSVAGDLASRTAYRGQDVAWTAGRIPAPRWLSWYSGLPARPATTASPAGDLVLVKRWEGDGLEGLEPEDREGRYWLVRVGDLP